MTAPLWRRALPWTVASVLAGALAVALLAWAPWRPAPVPTSRRLLASIGADASLTRGTGASAILSPDGTTLAFVARQQGQTRLFVRKLDQLEAVPLAGTEGAESPFFSPDGQWIGFFAAGQLKKISVTGGAAIRLCAAPNGRGGTWASDDTIIFKPSTDAPVLLRVPASGGTPAVFGTRGEGAARSGGRRRCPAAVVCSTARARRSATGTAPTSSSRRSRAVPPRSSCAAATSAGTSRADTWST